LLIEVLDPFSTTHSLESNLLFLPLKKPISKGGFVKSTFLVTLLLCANAFAQSSIPADAKFLDQFSQHHMDAVEMAKMAEQKAEKKELRQMARTMVKDQTKEIDQMKSWRSKLYPQAAKSESAMQKMDIAQLESKQGHEFDMAFSEMMAKHHQQGIDMVNDVSSSLSNPQIKKFAQDSAKKQESEKNKLEQMTKHE
jgi:uncharacterized protein (DUF305 family)